MAVQGVDGRSGESARNLAFINYALLFSAIFFAGPAKLADGTKVIVASALLMFVSVPSRVIERSSVPSPVMKLMPSFTPSVSAPRMRTPDAPSTII